MGEGGLGGSTSQFIPQMQMPHHTQQRVGSHGVDLKEHSQPAVANNTECVLITRKFTTKDSSDSL